MNNKTYPIPADLIKEFQYIRKLRIFRDLLLKYGTYRKAKKASFEHTERLERAFCKVHDLYPELKGLGAAFDHVDEVVFVEGES